jgi:hypothetical protein
MSATRRPLVVAAALVLLTGALADRGDAVPVTKVGPCVTPEDGRDYVPGPDADEFQNGATGVTGALAVRVSKLKSYTAARFVGGDAEGKIGTWGINRPRQSAHGPAFGLDRNARRWTIQGVDARLSVIARTFGLRASDPAAKKARRCVSSITAPPAS